MRMVLLGIMWYSKMKCVHVIMVNHASLNVLEKNEIMSKDIAREKCKEDSSSFIKMGNK